MHTQRRTAAYTLQTLTLCWLCLMFLGGNSLAQTVTVSFDFDGFTEIFVSELCLPCTSVFNVAVTQGPDFVVEVTIDEDEVDSLDVTQTGTRLDFTLVQGKNQNIETLEARVTLPVLNNIDLDGVVKATLSGFNQTQLAVDVGNVSQLRGDSLMISDLTASVSGVSELDFGDISPLETASISVSGVSKATLNMNINSSLTGSVSDVSQLFYYGTNVAVSVETDIISSFIRLGDTRPGGFSERLYFAQFGNGQGFTSDTVLTNSSATETISGQVDFFDGDGLPLSMGLTSGEASSVEFEIPALGMTTIRSDGQGETMVGSAVVSSDRRVGGVVRFNISGIGIAGVSASQPLDGFITPVRRQLEGINTGVAIHNTESQPVTLNLALRDKQGTPVPNGTRTIEDFPAGGQLAQFIGGGGEVLFPDADTNDFEGTLVVEVTGGKVKAMALELGNQPGQFTTLPVTPLQ